jgi:hypothetical protein
MAPVMDVEHDEEVDGEEEDGEEEDGEEDGLIIPPGVDPEVFRELPAFMQAELIEAAHNGGDFAGQDHHLDVNGQHHEMLGYDQATLDELPFEIRQEILGLQERLFQIDNVHPPPPPVVNAGEEKVEGAEAEGSTALKAMDVTNLMQIDSLPGPPIFSTLFPLKEKSIQPLLRMIFVAKDFNITDWSAGVLLKLLFNLTSLPSNCTALLKCLVDLASGTLLPSEEVRLFLSLFY